MMSISTRKLRLRKLFPTFADPDLWRDRRQKEKLDSDRWQRLRRRVLQRDDFTCQYCGYRSEKYQIVHHLDENPMNNDENNLTTICQMCNLIKHSGQGCKVKGIVDLYKESKYGQNDIIRITREMRDQGKSDEEIIKFLGLKYKVPFKMNKKYLKKLFGFVTSRSTGTGDDMYDRWKAYHARPRVVEELSALASCIEGAQTPKVDVDGKIGVISSFTSWYCAELIQHNKRK